MIDACVIAFYHPRIGKPVFLANTVDTNNIFYKASPSIPGTLNVEKAKIFENVDNAKALIYLLRYHRREFLHVLPIIKHVDITTFNFLEKTCIEEYDVNDFYIENS